MVWQPPAAFQHLQNGTLMAEPTNPLRDALRTAVLEQLDTGPVTTQRLEDIKASIMRTLEQADPVEGRTVADISVRAAIAAHLDSIIAEIQMSIR
jgi:hypothetical protein